jgi:hypothetical protein
MFKFSNNNPYRLLVNTHNDDFAFAMRTSKKSKLLIF